MDSTSKKQEIPGVISEKQAQQEFSFLKLRFLFLCRHGLDESFLRERGFFPYVKHTGCSVEMYEFLLQALENDTHSNSFIRGCRYASLGGMPEVCHLFFLKPRERIPRIAELRKWLAKQELVE